MARNMAFYSLSIVFMLFIHFGESYLDTLYTSSDEQYLSNVIRGSQDKKTGLFEKSLTTTYYATQALSLSSGDNIPNAEKLCTTLKSHKISSWEEFHNLLLSRSRIPNCLDAIKDSSIKKLNDGISANKLSKVYFSINGIYTLSATNPNLFDTSSLNLIDILTHIESFQLNNKLFTEQLKSSKSKSSIHKTSMALYAIAKLLSLPTLTPQQQEQLQSDKVQQLLISFMSTANVLVKDYSKLTEDMISYSSSLTATSVVLESIHEFLKSVQSIRDSEKIVKEFNKFNDKKYLENIIRYILTFRSTTSPTSARHVLVIMNMVKVSDLFSTSRPIAVRMNNKVFSDDAAASEGEKALTISITDIYGQQILASNDNTRVEIVAAKEKRLKKEGATGAFTKIDGSTYAFPFGKEVRSLSFEDGAHGVYSLSIDVSDDHLDGATLSIQNAVKVTTKIAKTVFGIQYTKKSDGGYNRKTYPATFSDVYDVSPSQKVKLEVQVKSVKKASQIVIEFVDFSGDSVLQIVPKTRQEKYGITIDLNKATFSVLKEGRYSLNLIVGDELFASSLVWNDIVSVNCIEEEDEAERDYEPVDDEVPKWQPKQAISHTFNEAEPEAMIIFPMVFCLVVAAPFLLFMYYVFVSIGTVIAFEKDSHLYSFIFIVTLSAIVSILFLYWWKWNIFEAAGWLTIACLPAFFFGYRVLKNHLLRRTNLKRN